MKKKINNANVKNNQFITAMNLKKGKTVTFKLSDEEDLKITFKLTDKKNQKISMITKTITFKFIDEEIKTIITDLIISL